MTKPTDERPRCLVSMTEEEAKNFQPATEMEIMEALARGRAEADAAFPWRGANLGLLYGRLGKPMAEDYNVNVETGRTSTKDKNESNPPRAGTFAEEIERLKGLRDDALAGLDAAIKERNAARLERDKSNKERETLWLELRTAIRKGWNNGGTLVSFCSYCKEYDPHGPVARDHGPTCMTKMYFKAGELDR